MSRPDGVVGLRFEARQSKHWRLRARIRSTGKCHPSNAPCPTVTKCHLTLILMHPRNASELEIDVVDLRTCNVAVAWVSAKLHRVITAASTEGTQRRHPDVEGLDCTYILKMTDGFKNAKKRRE
jgi:hypothetical protein